MITDLLQIVLLFVLPVALIQTGIFPIKYRMVLLGILVVAILGIVRAENWTLSQLGIRTDNLSESLIPHALFTVAGVLALALVAKKLGRRAEGNWYKHPHFLGQFIPISVAQVFAYRSFLIPELSNIISSPWFVILGHTVLFTYLHIIFPNRKVNLPVSFLGGLGFGALYYFYPNFYAAALAHICLNFAAVYYGFFGLTKVPER